MGVPMASALICVPPSDLWSVWPMVEPLIDAAYAEVDQITPDVLSWLEAQKGLLWIATDGLRVFAACTTSLERRRSGLACRIVACTDESGVSEWKRHLPAIEQYARREGCVKIEVSGRQGWSRVLPGYAPKTVSLEKRL